MLALALTTLDAVRFHELHIGADREDTLQLVCQCLLHGKHTSEVVAEEVASYFYLNLKRIEIVLAVHHKHVLRFEFRHSKDDTFHLRREDVDTTDNEHIVAASHDASHLHRCTSTSTWFIVEGTEVLGTIAEHRHTFLGKGSEHEFALSAVWQLFEGFRIDDFRIEMVFVDVRAVLFLTFIRYTRTHNFAQAIDVVTLQAEAFFDFLAHIVSPRFSTERTDTQADVFLAQAHLFKGFCQIERIRRGTCDTRNLQVANEADMLFGITRRSRDNGCAEVFHAIVSAKTTGEQAIAVCHREGIVASHTEGSEASCHDFTPYGQVLAGIAHNSRITRSTR